MARIESWVKCELNRAVQVQYLQGNLFSMDNQGNLVGVEVFDDGEPASLSGTVSANVIRADGATVAVSGTLSGNKCSVILPQTAYHVPGTITIVIKLTASSVVTTLAAVVTTVYRSSTEIAVDPGTIINDINSLIASIDAAVASIPADYSSLWATVAPAYTNVTFPVKKGQYCTYNGHMYRAKQDISSSESFTSSHWGVCNIGTELFNQIGADTQAISDLKSAMYSDDNLLYTFTKADMEQGSWGYSTKTSSTKRLRNKNLIPVKAGTIIKYSNPTQKVYFGVLETKTSNSYLQSIGWINAGANGEARINYDGYMTYIVEGSDPTTVDDYNVTTKLYIPPTQKEVTELTQIFKSALVNNNIPVYRHGGLDDNLRFYESNDRVLIDFANYGGKVLKLTIRNGYDVLIYTSSGLYKTKSASSGTIYYWLYAYNSVIWAFVIRKTDTTSPVSFDEAYANVIIEDAEGIITEEPSGLCKESVELLPGVQFYELEYINISDRASSAPIKIPKSGLKITFNPEKAQAGTAPNWRVICVKKTDSGFALCTTDADLLAESGASLSTKEPVYIPYIEDAYIIINTGSYSNTPANLVDAIWVYSGEIQKKGKLLGLHPMRVFIRNGVPSILWGTKQSIINTTYYLGGFLWLKYAKSITVFPKYSIVANIYELNDDGTTTLKDSYWVNEMLTDAGRVSGVQYIDLTQYDFNGFVHFAIHCPVMYRARSNEQTVSYKTPIGMGVMARYLDVYDSVLVEYKNSYQETVEQGMPPVLFENINKYMEYTYPLRLQSYYVHEWEKYANRHLFTETEDATPAFYAGAFDANAIFLNVIGKSYYTGMANINSRCYQFVRNNTDYGRIGYGLTCTDFVSVLLGLKENYPATAMAFGDPVKFTKITDNWNYQTEMDLLKPGDVLTEYKVTTGEGPGEYTESHCMICYEKKYINGQLEAVMVIEAGYPYTRFTTLYNDKYYPLTGAFVNIRRLADYKTINRIKPEYLEKIDTVFDLKRTYTPGTVMCDRGTNSIYCVNPVDSSAPNGTKELESPELILTINDEDADYVKVYKDGTEITTGDGIAIQRDSGHLKNGYPVIDIRYIVTSPGLYTVKTKTNGTVSGVQETFWVQGAYDYETGDSLDVVPEGYKRVHVSHLSALRYMDVQYTKAEELNGNVVTTTWHKIYTPEEFSADTDHQGETYHYDSTWGVVDVPAPTFDDPEHPQAGEMAYRLVKLIYGTDYGTFQVIYRASESGKPAIPMAYVEYSFGA